MHIYAQLFFCAHAWVDHFRSAFKHVFHSFAMIPAHSASFAVFQAQKVVLNGTNSMQGDLVHSGRGSIVYVH